LRASVRFEACLGSRRSRPGHYKFEFLERQNVSASQRGHKGTLRREIVWIVDERVLLRASVVFVNFVAKRRENIILTLIIVSSSFIGL
jgi:hypothetical protein